MAANHEESRRIDSGRDQAESQKSVDQAASGQSKTGVDDDWGFEPKKGGMAIEAKMGMCIVVILISAFGFLVYRKFDARQRSLLQTNLQAAEQALPGSTSGGDKDPYAEFQPSSQDLNETASTEVQSQFDHSSASGALPESTEMAATFGSSFALQDSPASSPEASPSPDFSTEATSAGSPTGGPFDNSPFAGLDEPAVEANDQDADVSEDSTVAAVADESPETKLAGQISSPLDDYLADRKARETAPATAESATKTAQADSPFAAFGDPEQSARDAAPKPTSLEEPSTETEAEVAKTSAFGEPEKNLSATKLPAKPEPVEAFRPSAFEDFSAGFDQEPSAAAVAVTPKKDEKEESSWAEFGQEPTAEEDRPFENPSSHDIASSAVDTPTEQWAPVKQKSEPSSPSPAFAAFDSFDTDSIPSVKEPTQPVLVEHDSPFRKPDDSTATAGSLQAANQDDVSPAPAFDAFGTNEDSKLVTFDPMSAHERPSESTQPAADRADAVPPGFEDTFASSDADRAELPPSPAAFDGSDHGFSARRRPLVDPATVMETLNGADAAALISKTEPLSNDVPPFADPNPSALEPATADSFNSFGHLDSDRVEGSLSADNGLGMPSHSNSEERVAATTGRGKIVQVSGNRDPDGIYTVKDDDTYWTISKHAYGTARFFSSLALYNRNRIKDPRRLRKGMKVLIPDPHVLIERYPELLQDYIPKETKPSGYFLKANGMPAYRIGERETLSEISQKHLGRASRWIQLYRMNQNVLENPNRLKPGTVINLPDDATNVHVLP